MEEREGYISHITFRNSDNGYTVCEFVADDEEITCVGMFPVADEGSYYALKGEIIIHPNYGEQFKVTSCHEAKLPDLASVERYLGSGAVKGIGLALAARIVRHFKEDTLRIVEEEPERLAEIKGISEKKARDIGSQVEEKKDLRDALMYLQQFGISMNLSVKIFKKYREKLYDVMRNNPYQLAEDIEGVGFKVADEIARKIGFQSDSDFRIRSGLLYTLLTATGSGHTFLPKIDLVEQASSILGVDANQLELQIDNLSMERKIIQVDCEDLGKGELEKGSCKEKLVQVYSASLYYLEKNTASMLLALDEQYDIPELEMNQKIRRIERLSMVTLDEMQIDAVKKALSNGVLVLTGGPGTGKTTTINFIIQYLENEGLDIVLGAPTGRAAKRMQELTGYDAKTIHRLLEMTGSADGSSGGFERNASNPLEADVVIIDEMSMVDISLMHALVSAIVPGTRLIMVGDANQLPSVGPGNVLKDIINSKGFCTVELKKIFRQASSSSIVVNAHKINAGESIELDNKNKDFFFLKRYEADQILNVVLQMIMDKLPNYVDAKPYDIQVLTPMRKGLLGVERCNRILQEYMNPKGNNKEEIEHGDGIFREGDKIMQIKNNYQLEWEVVNKYNIPIKTGTGIYNGDVGTIHKIDQRLDIMTVRYDEDHMVRYSTKMLDELELAYAITVHKSQGSEYPAIIIPLLQGPSMLFNRNLLYTAITRAKKCVTIVGNEQVLEEMISNKREQTRYSGLQNRIQEILLQENAK